jgi:oligopeptide transport system substrate-binding protein
LILTSGCVVDPPADLVIINGTEPETLDPAIVTGQSEMRVVQGLFEGLTRRDPKTAGPIPGLAERWEVSPDKCTYTFHLRTNLVWSTGEPITADDVAYSWRRTLDPATASDYASLLFCLKNAEDFNAGRINDMLRVGVRALDPRTVRVELNHPTAFFLDLCASPALCIVPRQAIEKFGDAWLKARPLPASGAFELVCWRLNDKIRLRKNPRYWDAAHTQSEILDILPTGSPIAALNLYETGVADIVWDKDLVPAELIDELLSRPDFHTFSYLGTYFYRFNVTRKPLDDPRVRRAFALTTDRERIVRKLTKGGEKAAFRFVPDGTASYEPPVGLPRDPEAARKLLAEAGYPGGKGFPRLQYAFASAASGAAKVSENIAIELQQMWREELGVEIELRQIERKIFFAAQSQLDYDLSASSWVGDYNDPNTFLDLFMSNNGNNRTGWKDSRYDDLIRQANMQTDAGRRAGLFRQAETLLVSDEAPIVPLYFYAGFNYYDPTKIQGVYQNILDEHPLNAIRKVGSKSKVQIQNPAHAGSSGNRRPATGNWQSAIGSRPSALD